MGVIVVKMSVPECQGEWMCPCEWMVSEWAWCGWVWMNGGSLTCVNVSECEHGWLGLGAGVCEGQARESLLCLALVSVDVCVYVLVWLVILHRADVSTLYIFYFRINVFVSQNCGLYHYLYLLKHLLFVLPLLSRGFSIPLFLLNHFHFRPSKSLWEAF